MPARKRRTSRKKTERDYSNTHKRKIINETASSKKDIQPGHIIRFKYKGKYAHEPHPLVLCLNPRWKGMLHGLALRRLSEAELLKLRKLIKEGLSQKARKLTKLRLNLLKADIGDPKRFYKTRLKKFLSRVDKDCYRTYKNQNISSLKIVDYRFDDMDVETSKKIANKK